MPLMSIGPDALIDAIPFNAMEPRFNVKIHFMPQSSAARIETKTEGKKD